MSNQWGRTALRQACQEGHLDLANFLIEKNADIDLTDAVVFITCPVLVICD